MSSSMSTKESSRLGTMLVAYTSLLYILICVIRLEFKIYELKFQMLFEQNVASNVT